MKSNFHFARVFTFSVAFVSFVAGAGAAEVPGSLPGGFNVDNRGGAGYSIPLQVVPGIGGVEPSLSLDYHSLAGDGYVGVGWSLGGLSSISRAGTNTFLEEDGTRRAGPTSRDRSTIRASITPPRTGSFLTVSVSWALRGPTGRRVRNTARRWNRSRGSPPRDKPAAGLCHFLLKQSRS